MSEAEFKAALAQFLLDMRLDVASPKGIADSGAQSSPESLYARLCPDSDDCLPLVGGTGLPFGRKDRTLVALSFALDTVWESVETEVGKMLNPVALKAMLTSAALSVLLTMTLPEPVTKVLAVALTAAMVAYLGVIPVWEMGRGFVRLWEESEKATSVIEWLKSLQGLQTTCLRRARICGV